RIGKQQRDGVAGASLDAELTPAPGETEHEYDVRLRREQLWQIAIPRRRGRCENVSFKIDSGQSRAPSSGETFDQACTRVDWRAGEWAEADEKDAGHNFSISAIFSTAAAGGVTP